MKENAGRVVTSTAENLLMIAPGVATRVAWECIHVGNVVDGRAELERCKQKGMLTSLISANGINTENELFSRMSEALAFPSYFGMNWNALSDCLRDLSWQNPSGVLVVFEDSRDFWCKLSLSSTLIEVWLFCAEAWAKRGVPFHLAFTWAE